MIEATKTLLVIAAHPDDETLGCGGTIARLGELGVEIHVMFLADGVGSRSSKTGDDEIKGREDAAGEACGLLGAKPPLFGRFPDNEMDTVSLLSITKSIETVIAELRPDTILTHHAGDVNVDHRRIHDAVITACRPQPGHPVKSLMYFEVASSTEWQTPHSAPTFIPDTFVDITAHLSQKQAALEAYRNEVRAWPHSRSIQAITHLAHWRGATVGLEAAEAFMSGRHIF